MADALACHCLQLQSERYIAALSEDLQMSVLRAGAQQPRSLGVLLKASEGPACGVPADRYTAVASAAGVPAQLC